MTALRFSVVVPTYNRPAELAGCLSALAALEPPTGGFEVLIVNDGGTAPPAEAVDALRRSGSARQVRVIDQENMGPGRARNAGANEALGECLAFTDDDCRPAPGWLRAFDRAMRDVPDALVGGRTVNALTDNLYSTTSQTLIDFVASYFDGGASGRFFSTGNLALARNEFLDCGGFDPRFRICAAEDREFSERWWAQRRPSTVASDAIVHHSHELSLAGLSRQHFTYGRGMAEFRRLQQERGRPQRIRPTFYLQSLRYPFRHEPPTRAAAIASLTALAHAAYLTGLISAQVGTRERT